VKVVKEAHTQKGYPMAYTHVVQDVGRDENTSSYIRYLETIPREGQIFHGLLEYMWMEKGKVVDPDKKPGLLEMCSFFDLFTSCDFRTLDGFMKFLEEFQLTHTFPGRKTYNAQEHKMSN
jgi:hypothetical protein